MIENFEKLTFERKIDVLVAMHVLGWKDIVITEVEWHTSHRYLVMGMDRFGATGYIPLYSTLLTSAWDIVRKFDYLYLFRSKDFKKGQWECKLCNDGANNIWIKDGFYAWAETEQLAICYAGLKAKGYDVRSFLRKEGKCVDK